MTVTYRQPAVSLPAIEDAGKQGRVYAANAINSTSLGILGGTVISVLQVSNPAGSGATLYVSKVFGSSQIALNLLSGFSASISAVSGGTISPSTPVTAGNLNLGSSRPSSASINSSTAAVSGGTLLFQYPIQPGGADIEVNGSIVVRAGQSVSVVVSSALTLLGVLTSATGIEWWEV